MNRIELGERIRERLRQEAAECKRTGRLALGRRPLTYNELLALGQLVDGEDGMPDTMLESHAHVTWCHHQAGIQARRGVCCDDPLCRTAEGYCSNAGEMCPQYAAEEFVKLVDDWCERFDQESIYGGAVNCAAAAESGVGPGPVSDDEDQGPTV